MGSPETNENWHRVGVQAVRAPFLSAAIVAVLVGSAVAYNDGTYRWDVFIITLIAAVAVHAGTNVWNDYFDHLFKADDYHLNPTPFSGGVGSSRKARCLREPCCGLPLPATR